jgi:hypothetical protein
MTNSEISNKISSLIQKNEDQIKNLRIASEKLKASFAAKNFSEALKLLMDAISLI